MSSEALAWAFKQECKSASVKFTLVALCECANYRTGRITPSIEHLCEITGQNRKTIIANVAELEASGLIADTGDRVGRTRQIKVYQANLTKGGAVKGEAHYVYQLTDPDGNFYIGVRTCIGDPADDSYMGSGRWPLHCAYKGVPITKAVVSIHDSRTAADIAEAMAIKGFIGNPQCMNIEYKDTEKGIPNSGPLEGKQSQVYAEQSQKRDTEPSLEPSHSTEPNGSSECKARAKKPDPFFCPDGVDPIDWEALKANRKTKRAALTEGAHRQIVRKLQTWERDGWPPGPIVAFAAERGWTSVFETDEMKVRENGKGQFGSRQQPKDGVAQALDRRLGLGSPSSEVGRPDPRLGPGYCGGSDPTPPALR